ncbi:MAG: FHA domain-containing protein, partial [Dokdonella sp.]
MRLSFPNAEHPDVLAGDGTIRIGSAPGNDIVLADLAAHHARLTRDLRGIVLDIAESGARAHVNARPVREKAFVRYGDTLCLGSTSIAVSAVDPVEFSQVRRPGPVQGAQSGVIRGMSGTWFGKSVAIFDGLLISVGRDGGAVLGESAESTRSVRFGVGASGLSLESEESSGSLLNGRRIMSTALRNGDQLNLGRERFVIECSSAKPIEET